MRNSAVAGERLRGVHLGDWHAKAYGDVVAVLDDDAHVEAGLLPALAVAVDVPTAAHEHMSDESSAAGEMDEEPFAAGFDAIDELAGDGRVVVEAGEQGIGGAEDGDGLAGEGAAQSARAVRKMVSPSGMVYCTSPVRVGCACAMRRAACGAGACRAGRGGSRHP